jgi:hypothetical protein
MAKHPQRTGFKSVRGQPFLGLHDADLRVVAETIKRLHAKGLPYRSIAVLVRTRAAYPRLLDAFDAHDVPVQPAGRTGLFAKGEAQMFGKTHAWLVDHRWSSEPRAWGEIPTDAEVFDGYGDLHGLDDLQEKRVRERLLALKASVPSEDRPVSVVADFYELLGDLGVADWNADEERLEFAVRQERPMVGKRDGSPQPLQASPLLSPQPARTPTTGRSPRHLARSAAPRPAWHRAPGTPR